MVRRVAKGRTQLKQLSTHAYLYLGRCRENWVDTVSFKNFHIHWFLKVEQFFIVQISPAAAAAAAKLLQSCPTLCDPIDSSPPVFPIPGILQARTLEWVAISFSNAWKWKVKIKLLSCVRLFATPWTAAHEAPPSMDFPGMSTGVGCHCLLCK